MPLPSQGFFRFRVFRDLYHTPNCNYIVAISAFDAAAVMSWAVLAMPVAPNRSVTSSNSTAPSNEEIQQHYKVVFSSTPRIFAASLLAYLVGDFLNSIVLARRKVIDQGRAFWKRAIL